MLFVNGEQREKEDKIYIYIDLWKMRVQAGNIPFKADISITCIISCALKEM